METGGKDILIGGAESIPHAVSHGGTEPLLIQQLHVTVSIIHAIEGAFSNLCQESRQMGHGLALLSQRLGKSEAEEVRGGVKAQREHPCRS